MFVFYYKPHMWMRQMRATCAGYDEKECLEQIACQHTLDDLGDILDVNIVLLAR